MKLLTTPAEKLLLEEALDALHHQCRSWINQVALWEDEKTFFSNLINNKLFKTSDPEKQEIAELLQMISGKDIEALKVDLLAHETVLYSLLQHETGEGERNYRTEHKRISEKFLVLDNKLRSLRKSMFTLFRLVDHSFFNHNETLHTIYSRRAVRKYKGIPVEKHLIEEVLKAAAMAPSALNQQPWKFYVVTHSEKLKLFAAETLKAAGKMHHSLLEGSLQSEDPIYHGAPVIIFITAPRTDEWAGLDVGLCAQNLMLAARSLGLDTCPVGLANFMQETPVYGQLHIPDSEKIYLAVTLGYGDEHPEMHPRKQDTTFFTT